MRLVLNFAALISPYRALEHQRRDAEELTSLVKNCPKCDERTLRALGDMLYRHGGDDVQTMVHRLRCGEILEE
jgi:hypothetical protein